MSQRANEIQIPFDSLKLENQICFPVYAASRLIIREYQPHLDKLGITYPQYLVLMILWETDGISVNEISQKLILKTNTVTPLLKRMEAQELITRRRYGGDERRVIIHLTPKGLRLRVDAAALPQRLISSLVSDSFSVEELMNLKLKLDTLVHSLSAITG